MSISVKLMEEDEKAKDDLPPVTKEPGRGIALSNEELEKRLEQQTHARASERFFFISVLIVGYDAHTFKSFESRAGPVCLTVLEFAGLYVLAEISGIKNMANLIREGAMRLANKGTASNDPS